MIRFIQLFLIFFGINLAASAQVVLSEDFSSAQMPPPGWSIDNYSANWSISYTMVSGGFAIPEGKFYRFSQPYTGYDTTRLISPVVDLTGFDSVKLHFSYGFMKNGTGVPVIGVATRSAGGDWDSVWAIRPPTSVTNTSFDKWIKNSDVGSNQFQLCLFLEGNLYRMSYWTIDDITLYNPLNSDGTLTDLGITPAYVTGPFAIDGSVGNLGAGSIHSAAINWKAGIGPVHTTTISGLNTAPFSKFHFNCSDSVYPQPGKNNMVIWIDKLNGLPDDNHGNDTLRMTVQYVANPVARKPLFEEFTSSSCVYCPAWDYMFEPWCDSLGEKITVVKYQMNFPGVGDPYYTAEGGVRRNFYNVNGIPSIRCDGGDELGNASLQSVKTEYNKDTQEKAMMSLQANHTFSGHVISVNATVTPLADFTNLTLYGAVLEKTTYNNVGSNGQTEFRDVMMKMLPDASGVPLTLVNGQPFTWSGSVDLDGTHIERWDDLEVVFWVEDGFAGIVKQSTYSTEGPLLSSEARLQNILVDSVAVNGFDPNTFSYALSVPDNGGIPHIVKGIPMDTNATVVVTPSPQVPGTATIDVTAQDNLTHHQYTVSFVLNGIGEKQGNNITIFPNPASDRIFIYGAEQARISLCSAQGNILRVIDNFTGNTLYLNGIPKGVYILKAESANGSRSHYRIVIN